LRVLPIHAYILSEVLAPRYTTWAVVAIRGKIANRSLKQKKGLLKGGIGIIYIVFD
jgi:hypothetical protein